jgi:signal transduction histidine kinase
LDTKNPTLSVTYRLRHAITGRVSYILEQREAVFTESGFLLGYEGIWLDVTRQTIAERRLSSAAWKETLAVLTIGLAHDFSNIMAGIHSLSESFGVQLGADHPFNEGLALIRQNAMQASQLVRRILSLHHDKVGEQNYSNLNEIVADTVELMHKTIPRRVQVKMQLAPESLPLYVDAVELRQVLINLAVNSVDAMPNGGELSLSTSLHTQLPDENLRIGQVGRLPAVCLEVKDTGSGISSAYLSMIFDPFFTTKAVNKGSGLGLYNARLFVEKHHGAISVESVEGKGTTFRLWLPQADFTENDQVSTVGLPVRHTILLVGSPGQQLNRTTEYLRQHGFYVIVSVSPESAHEALGNPQCQLGAALVLCDGRQPWMLSLLNEIQQAQPPLKTAIQIIGCNIDELNPQALEKANLIISSDTSPHEILARLQTLLSAAHPPTS